MSKKSRSIGARLREAWNAFVGGGGTGDEVQQQTGDTINAPQSQGAINRPSGSVEQTYANASVRDSGKVQGANVGVNQGIIITRIIYGRDPAEAERDQVVRYLCSESRILAIGAAQMGICPG